MQLASFASETKAECNDVHIVESGTNMETVGQIGQIRIYSCCRSPN